MREPDQVIRRSGAFVEPLRFDSPRPFAETAATSEGVTSRAGERDLVIAETGDLEEPRLVAVQRIGQAVGVAREPAGS